MIVDHYITQKNSKLDVETYRITCDFHAGDTKALELSRRGVKGDRNVQLRVEHRHHPIPAFEFDVKVAREVAARLTALCDAIEGGK
jgi:hypothetical protein